MFAGNTTTMAYRILAIATNSTESERRGQQLYKEKHLNGSMVSGLTHRSANYTIGAIHDVFMLITCAMQQLH